METETPKQYATSEAQRAYSNGYAAGVRRAAHSLKILRAKLAKLRKSQLVAPTPAVPSQSQKMKMDGWISFRTRLPNRADATDGGQIELMSAGGGTRSGMWDWVNTADLWEVNGFVMWHPLNWNPYSKVCGSDSKNQNGLQ